MDYLFTKRFPDVGGYKRIPGRRAYMSWKGHQIYPVAGTIFEKSRVPLNLWFYAIYLFSVSKNGVAAKELQRILGVTYKTAWRMNRQIRSLMYQDTTKLNGIVEADETYVGGRRRSSCRFKNKSVVLGVVQRGGPVRVKVLKNRGEFEVLPFLEKNIEENATLYTDEAKVYNATRRFKRGTVTHSKYQYADGNIHTNTIEGFWGQFKRSVHGTYHYVSKQHLQSYIDEFAFRYNHRLETFDKLLERI